MSYFAVDKNTITRKVLGLINQEYTKKEELYARKSWWINIRTNGGLRLTEQGFNSFQLAQLENWSFELPKYLSSEILLKLDKHLSCPYYITFGTTNYIKIYDSRIATIIILYSNIIDFLNKN